MQTFRAAAKQGSAGAQVHLGEMYEFGRGVPQSHGEAANWYRLAADQGYARAQYNLGLKYANGEGVPQSNVFAHMWFNLAATRFPAAETQSRREAARNRDLVAKSMSAAELAEAQQMARTWKPN